MLFGEPFGGLIPGARGAVLATLMRTGGPLTGRQIHGLVRDRYSLWSIQEALKVLNQLGVVNTRTIGRAGVHSINDSHVAVEPLRVLLDPIALLTASVHDVVGDEVEAVILFGSVARGEATNASDVDLAVITPAGYDRRAALEDAVRDRLGNACDVLVLTPEDLTGRLGAGEPVVREIRADGVALVGDVPRDLGHRHVADQPMTRKEALAMHGSHAIDQVPDEPSPDPAA